MKAKGFTLIETVAVLLIVGVIAAVAGMGIVSGVRGFVQAREAGAMAMEAQLALDRITREVIELVDVPADSIATRLVVRNVGAGGAGQFDRSIEYVPNVDGNRGEIRIANGAQGAQNGDTLIDNVTAFSLNYWQEDVSTATWSAGTDPRLLSGVDVTFTLTAPGGTTRTFSNRIVPRNNENRGGALPEAVPPSLERFDICFVATAASGDTSHPVVVQLREFRDRLLLTWGGGRMLVRAYYTVGPRLADMLHGHDTVRAAVMGILTPLAALCGMAVHAPIALGTLFMLSLVLGHMLGAALRGGTLHRETTPLQTAAADNNSPTTARHLSGNDTGKSDGTCIARHDPTAADHGRNGGRTRGAVLISVIVTIVAFSVIGAAMVPMMTASTQNSYFAVQGDQAYYLAESGFGAAGSMFLAAGDEQARKNLLQTMDGSTYTFANNAGAFRLGIEPYWFEATSNTGTRLVTRVYGTAPTLPTNTTGRLRIGNAAVFYTYSNIQASGNTVTFTLTQTPSPPIDTGADIFLSATPTSTSVGNNGDLTLNSAHAAAFPNVNGMFTVRGGPVANNGRIAYVYRRKNGNTLEDVRLVEGQGVTWSDISLSSASDVTLESYLRLHSTGIPAGGMAREVIYNVPIGWILGGGNFSKEQYQDNFASLANWFAGGASEGHLGTHNVNGGTLNVTGMVTAADSVLGQLFSWFTGSNRWSSIFFNWGRTNVNLARGWADTYGNSSYDLQFKTSVANQATQTEFFGGVLFRGRNSGSEERKDLDGYGISLVRFRQRLYSYWFSPSEWHWPEDVPSSLVPGYVERNNADDIGGPLFGIDSNLNESGRRRELTGYILGIPIYENRTYRYSWPAILLWERRGGQFRWLAYKKLGSSSGIVTYSSTPTYRLDAWPSLLMRLVEGQELRFSNGGGADGAGGILRINYGDEIITQTGAKARVIGQPIVESGDWTSGTASGRLVLTNVDTGATGSFGNGQELRVNNIRHATIGTGGLGAKTNFIRVYYSDAERNGIGDAVPYTPLNPGGNSGFSSSDRRSNPRLGDNDKLRWIPDDYEQWKQTTDYFSLVEWDDVNTAVTGVTSLDEYINGSSRTRTIVRSTNLLSPTYDANNPVYSPSEGIAIVTSGPSGNNFSFDDFGLQLDLRGGKGFLPPIQQ